MTLVQFQAQYPPVVILRMYEYVFKNKYNTILF